MALTNAFYEAIQSRNIRRVRIMMQDSLLVDPTFTEFNSMEKEASTMVGLYDKHDGKELVEDRSQWNDEYMDKLMVKSLSNFSHERIDHLKEVVRYLRPIPENAGQTNQNDYNSTRQMSYEEEKRLCQERGDYLGAQIGVGAAVGAAVGGAIVSVSGATVAGVIGGAVAGAVVGGITTNFIVNGVKDDE